MLKKIFFNLFKRRNDRIISQIKEKVKIINDMEPEIEKLSDKQLRYKTYEFKKKIQSGININKILPEAFAVVRESSKRVFGMRHFDVQLIGGIVLNNFCIAEMRTGEGKTLTSTLPAYLNALIGKGVHIVTVNDYLAKRDAENNRQLFEFLGLTVGVNLPGLSKFDKRSAYLADITYGTNNEYGFDYLRDNMVFHPKDRVQRKLYFALIDEIDSILIDEARTPLVISGSSEDYSELYKKIDRLIPFLTKQEKEDSEDFQGTGHFYIDEKSKQVNLTERGLILIEKLLVKFNLLEKDESLYSSSNIILIQHVISALRAHALFFRNVDYIVKNNMVIIVDDHTGRTLPGRRWSDGLHQALEAKENVFIHNENQTLASITFQNYFRLYEKLAGMTGTAETESFEFKSIYKLDTIVIPTNRPMIRKDFSDLVYITEKEKINAIIQDIKKCVQKKQPVLVGTISIEKSEAISNILKKENIRHKILNAKFHDVEAEIIAQAGQPGAVTIATNMAGRGTDIVLGGNWKSKINSLKGIAKKEKIYQIKKAWKKNHEIVISVGGLHVIGTERHESRRIDNQLRGRSGRQGDIGSSRFYVSMEDSLMRIFASEKISFFMRRFGVKFGEAIEHPLITKAIANAQRRVENRNFDVRKQLLEYDDVTNIQRLTVYKQRNELLDSEDVSDFINDIRNDVVNKIVVQHITFPFLREKKQLKNLVHLLNKDFCLNISFSQYINNSKNISREKIFSCILHDMDIQYQKKRENLNKKFIKKLEKNIVLKTIDIFWKEHLLAMEFLRQGIHLRGYAQKDPKEEYKRESFLMFSSMMESLKYEIISSIYRI